jgi:UDP-N-acetylglucosamine--N-acetylmuramyl-(pentapeptide) pyrophosphoryl-undecaprenol N-acetylglucosamine transferase
LAVAAEIKKLSPDTRIVFIGQKGGHLLDIVEQDPYIDSSYQISAGKFRRYHGEGLTQLLDFNTQYKNVKDLFRTVSGLTQSWRLLAKIRPAVVFTRGGYVSVPVALAAWLRHIPYITHDSDSMPSLANRIIAPKAAKHAVALEPSMYPYPLSKTVRVGVPISSKFQTVDDQTKQRFKKEIALDKFKQMLFVTGGGNGAEQLNSLVKNNVEYLLKKFPQLVIVHIAGRNLSEALEKEYDNLLRPGLRKRVIVKDFVTDLYRYSGAADIIIARGGATNLTEFAAQRKTCIIIPSSRLIWNLRNAHALAKQNAIIELSEDQAEQELRLAHIVSDLLDHKESREELETNFAQFYVPDAAKKIAELLLEIAYTSEVNK